MARLKARNRTEIWKIEKEVNDPGGDLTVWEKASYALMSDGWILSRRQVRFKPDKYDVKGRLHDYGSEEERKMGANEPPTQLLEKMQLRGFAVVGTPNMSAWNTNYAKALEASKKASVKRAEKAKKEAITKNGPGFYVRNRFMSEHKPWAVNFGPTQDLEAAIEDATKRRRGYVEMRFDYLLPVQVVQAASRHEAEYGGGHVWWTDGKSRGAPVNPAQTSLF